MQFLLHQLLERTADRYPDAVAVVDGSRELTYGELDSRANQLARLLIEEGVSKGDRVGLLLDKSLESVIGIYGVLKAGAAYVPLDPQAPTTRLAYIIGNCGVRSLLTGREKAETWAELEAGCPELETLVVLNAGAGESPPGPNRLRRRTATDLDSRSTSRVSVRTIDRRA